MDYKDEDVWLMQGDCLERIKEIQDDSVDLTVTSPPYDNLRTYNTNNKTWNEKVWKDIIKELYRVTNNGGILVWVVGDATIKGSETGTSFKQALWAIECGFNLHDTMIWEKTAGMPQNQHPRYTPIFEYMFVLCKGYPPKTFNPLKVKSKNGGKVTKAKGQRNNKDDTFRHEEYKEITIDIMKRKTNVWQYAPASFKGHPAPFPIKLSEDHIKSWSNDNDTTLDPFMGSGTTGVACKNLNRKFIGIELDKEYFEIAKNRINDTSNILQFTE